MKILSTTGSVLIEKNIFFDINPQEDEITQAPDQITSVVSNPNAEEMFVAILTKNGKIIKYRIRLEK